MTEVRLLQRGRALPTEEIEGVVTRAQAGDSEAFVAIFNRYAKPIFSFIFHLLGDRGRAEELTQETFYRAYRRLASIRDETELSTWLFGIARNVVREAIKGKYRQARETGLDEQEILSLEDERIGPDEHLISGEVHDAVRRALSSLNLEYRLVFVLKVFQNMSYEEISRITGASVGKLKTDLHRARRAMRRKLRPYLRDPEPKL